MDIKNAWNNLDPNIKRWLAIGAAGGAIVGLALLSENVEPPKFGGQQKSDKIRHLLTDTDPRSLTIDALAHRVKELQQSQKQSAALIAQLREEIGKLRMSDEAKFKNWTKRQREEYERQLAELRAKLEEAKAESESAEKPKAEAPKKLDVPGEFEESGPKRPDVWQPYGTAPAAPTRLSPGQGKPKAPITIRVVSGNEKIAQQAGVRKKQWALPAGTIITGVLLNGMDAPTAMRARQDPQPVLIRVKREAILPNRYRSDIRECFMIGAGYGDLSSERAYIRTETITCVRDDRSVIEKSVDGYLVGEDGKVGIRGRLVSKQGRILANAMIAGFAKGFSQVFAQQQVPVIVQNKQDVAPFQRVLSAQSLQSGAIRGVGESLERLAQFYLDMAENLFPVIEVDAGRKVEIVINRGLQL